MVSDSDGRMCWELPRCKCTINFYAIAITTQMICVQFNVTLVHFSTASASNFLICLRVPIIAEWVVAIRLCVSFVPGRTYQIPGLQHAVTPHLTTRCLDLRGGFCHDNVHSVFPGCIICKRPMPVARTRGNCVLGTRIVDAFIVHCGETKIVIAVNFGAARFFESVTRDIARIIRVVSACFVFVFCFF